MEWQPIETAPTDGTVIDITAKCWMFYSDTFKVRRFPDCYWTKGDSMSGRNEHWVNVDNGWRPTHWMPRPEPPK